MRKLHMFGLLLVAMCALGASFVASASAETPKFLVDGVVPAAATASNTEGELLFESLKTSGATFLCSAIFLGTIAAGGELYLVEKVLNLEAVEETETEATAKITCTPDTGSICSKAAVTPLNLPWDSDPVLGTVANDNFLEVLANVNGVFPAYFLLCEALGLDVTELCELLNGTTQLVLNAATDLEFEAGTSPSSDAHCSGDSAEVESGGLVVDTALQFVTGKTLAISE